MALTAPSSPRAPFARARWAVAVATLLGAGAMWRYPGGTVHDRAATRYSLSMNFLSDLGMTVSYGGRPNRLGATLFVFSLLLLIVGLGGALVGFVKISAVSPASQRWARVAAAFGFLACAAFTGVAFTPENHAMALHISFTTWAWRFVPGAALCLGVASLRSERFPRRIGVTWIVLAAFLLGYVVLHTWGPTVWTIDGLRAQVIGQKAITAIVIAFVVYLSIEMERLLARRVADDA